MTKTIDTLIEDIKGVLKDGVDEDTFRRCVDSGAGQGLGALLMREFVHTSDDKSERADKHGIWFSKIGTVCDRELWLSANPGFESISARPELQFMFGYGHVLEDLMLELCKVAGHSVEFQQERVELSLPNAGGEEPFKITGRWDGVIDGHVVDVKSVNQYSASKFIAGITPDNDLFGYLDQLCGYHAYAKATGVVDTDTAYFLWVCKSTGRFGLDKHIFTDRQVENWIKDKSERFNRVLNMNTPPSIPAGLRPGRGKGKLSTKCSYCFKKQHCYPNLRGETVETAKGTFENWYER